MATPKQPDQAAQQSSSDSAKLFTWVKGLEAKTNNLLRETSLLKSDSIKKVTDLRKEVKLLSDEFLEIKRTNDAISQKMDLIIKELKKTAGQEEVMVLRKYIDLWNPLTFVTQRDLERMVDAKLAMILAQHSPSTFPLSNLSSNVHNTNSTEKETTRQESSHSIHHQTKDINNPKHSSKHKKGEH
ncbi:hypothetical protein HYV86_00375 [Candidatus Woesearchaeota archaeon]|nr:hypothetical protein [Candidatus Woesearchaeota archaeon]